MRHLRRVSLALAVGLAVPLPAPAADGVAGPYLAARQAAIESDYRAAAEYFTRALIGDPQNPQLLENAVLAQLAIGEPERALPVARQMVALDAKSQIAALVVLSDLARQGKFDEAIAQMDAGLTTGPLIDGLFRAWGLVGEGRMGEAIAAFDKVATTKGMESFGLYHKALALASVGDFEGAEAIFVEAGRALSSTRRGILAHAEILSQLERNTEAIALLDTAFKSDSDPGVVALRQKLEAGTPIAFDMVANATDGLAETFMTVAGAVAGDAPDPYTLAYARLSESLRPANVDGLLLVADLLERQGQHDLATAVFAKVPRTDPAFLSAELGRGEALINAGRVDAAIEVLEQLAKDHPESGVVWVSLGDTLRRQDRYADAVKAYDNGIATFRSEQPAQWPVYYARGIAHERIKDWPAAEKDFRKALELSPDQPLVLNYLGYSYLEMKTNLDEALSMIERAVKARPDDGYITDSLGWALYRLGRYDEAVAPMERAVELTPVDAIVNDHLGDVYWAVGRKREAEFQWKRALSFKPPTEEEAKRIRRKLEVGLDAVLAEEGAPPLAVSQNGD